MNVPYSWGDVADTLSYFSKKSTAPASLVKAEVYWDQVTFYVAGPADSSYVYEWLESIFPFRIKGSAIVLDGPTFSQNLPFSFDVYDQDFAGTPPPAIPSQYVAASSQIWFRHSPSTTSDAGSLVPTFAFHSVKGGVGRTTSALSFAISLVEKHSQRPLLVDADFEAPGISYLFHGDGREVHISLEDVLVLAHAETDAYAEGTVQFAAEKLSNQAVGNITVLPCLRALDMLSAFAIRPEQLQRSHSDQPFILLNILQRIAVAAGCTSIIIDLRAGFTDLAAMVLCAPHVAPVFVTTPSGQAVASTRQMLEFIGTEVNGRGTGYHRPAVIINNVISQVRRSPDFERIVQSLEDSAASFVRSIEEGGAAGQIIEFSDEDVLGVPVVALDHAPALTAAPSTLRFFIDDLQTQSCFDQLSTGLLNWTSQFLETAGASSTSDQNVDVGQSEVQTSPELKERRQKLFEFARQRIFAESGDNSVDDFLVVRALQQLATRFKTELPNATCIGMKGAGKTFSFRILCQYKKWSSFVAGIAGDHIDDGSADIVPILPARSLQQFASIQLMRSELSVSLGAGDPISFSQLSGLIESTAQKVVTEAAWAEFWLDAIGWSCGLEPGKAGAGKSLVHVLIQQKRRIVGVLDGLEDIFQAFRSDPRQQTAIRGLTSALPQLLSELPGRPIGQINFVRSDLVGAAFPNNARQFADRNRAFALTWYERDILELAAWLAKQAGVADTWDHTSQNADTSVLQQRLQELWGRKLGKADDLAKQGRTREPRSAEWVIAALSDLRGRLTARDLVGFIASSAERSILDQNALYKDRLLTPRAMSGAIAPVGREKIAAMAEENPGLKPVIELLSQAPQFSVPISLSEFQSKMPNLNEEALKMLQENGIILVAGDSVEMPEIFRTALSNVVRAKGGRRSIIGLMNKARQYRILDPAL